MHKYFVSYSFFQGELLKNGNAEISWKDKIESLEHVNYIQGKIEEDLKIKDKDFVSGSVRILNWRTF